MGIRLRDLVADERTISVDIPTSDGPVPIRVKYRPSLWTLDFERHELAKLTEEAIVERFVLWWDLLTDDGELLPPTAAALGPYPKIIATTIAFAIAADVRAGKALVSPTAGSSPPADSSAPTEPTPTSSNSSE